MARHPKRNPDDKSDSQLPTDFSTDNIRHAMSRDTLNRPEELKTFTVKRAVKWRSVRNGLAAVIRQARRLVGEPR
jgi:hypothetical protein